MESSLLRPRQGRVLWIATALGINAATIPFVLGSVAAPSAAATSSGSSAITAQQIVADAECDIAWVEYDNEFTYNPEAATPPSCAPVPAGFQEAFSNLWYDYCEFTNQLGGNHGICFPAATNAKD